MICFTIYSYFIYGPCLNFFFSFFFFGKNHIYKNQLTNRTNPVEQHTITIILKGIKNVHRRTTKRNKFRNLDSTHPSQQINTTIGLSVAMVKLNVLKTSCQMPTIIQKRRNGIVHIRIILKNLHHCLSIHLNNKEINV